MFPRVTHPSATASEETVRLACVKPAASVRSEPGSNSQVETRLASGPSDVLDLHIITYWRPISPEPKSRKVGHVVPASSSIPGANPRNFLSRRHAASKPSGISPTLEPSARPFQNPQCQRARRQPILPFLSERSGRSRLPLNRPRSAAPRR